MRVVVCGTFDYAHEGHKHLFEYVKKVFGRIDRVYITTDEFVSKRKIPTHNQKERWLAVSKLVSKNTQLEFISTNEDFRESICMESPCVVIHANDHNINTLSEIYCVEHNWWENNQIYLLYKDRYPGISSTQLRELEKCQKKEN